MATTLTQISNVFNLIVQVDSRLEFYHYGWRTDINKNIYNNFDPKVTKGKMFPAVHFDKPDGIQSDEEPGYLGTGETIEMQLYFDTLQDYNNDGSANTLNLIEQEVALKTIAKDFMANLIEVIGPNKYNIGAITKPKYIVRPNMYNQKLITWEVSFSFTHTVPCTESQYKIDLSLLPSTIAETDIERVGGSVIDSCLLLLANLSEQQKNECILPTYDFNNNTVWDNTTSQQRSDMSDRLCSMPPVCHTNYKGLNEYTNLGNHTSLNFNRTDTFSISAWIYITSYADGMIMAKYSPSRGWYFGRKLDGSLWFSVQHNGAISGIQVTTPINAVPLNTWSLVTASYGATGLASGVEITIDTIVQSKSVAFDNLLTNPFTTSLDTRIGSFETGWFFVGNMANVAAFNTVLSGANISTLDSLGYTNSVMYSIPGVVSHYLMNRLDPRDEVGVNNGFSFNQDATNIICL